LWVQSVGAFKATDAKAWQEHPAAGLASPECPFVPEGWAVFGPFVPWMVLAGYSPQNAPRRMGGPGVADAVATLREAVPDWESGRPDASVRWWSDGWYRSVGFSAPEAALCREVGWEPPLAAWLRRFAGGVQVRTAVSRMPGVPASLLRQVWREGLAGWSDRGLGQISPARWDDLVAWGSVAGADAGAWLDRFGSVATAARAARSGLTPDLLSRLDATWPGHDLFQWLDAAPTGGPVMDADWLEVALATAVPGEALPPDAHAGNMASWPGWVADFQAAGVASPAEALAMLESGVDRESLRMLAALRA
jgi:hypothetical protein